MIWRSKKIKIKAGVVINTVETTLTKTQLQYRSKTKGCIAQPWNCRVRKNQYALQKQMQDALV